MPVTGPTKFSLTREAFRRLVRGEVIELRPDVSIALNDIGFEAMTLEITEAWQEKYRKERGVQP